MILDQCESAEGLTFAGAGDTDGIDANQADFSTFTYAAPEICTDCDGVWFDRMGMAQVGDKIALVSYAEVGGPLQPQGLDAVMPTCSARPPPASDPENTLTRLFQKRRVSAVMAYRGLEDLPHESGGLGRRLADLDADGLEGLLLGLAVPEEPETMAPAWPMVLPSGAVKPAT